MAVVGLQFGALLSGPIVTENDFQLAGAGKADDERDLEPRLCAGAGPPTVDRTDACVAKLFYGRGVSVGESEDVGVAE